MPGHQDRRMNGGIPRPFAGVFPLLGGVQPGPRPIIS